MEKRDADKRLQLKKLLMEIYDMRPSVADRWIMILDYVDEHRIVVCRVSAGVIRPRSKDLNNRYF